jgi:predicted RNA-binding protein with PIN domain
VNKIQKEHIIIDGYNLMHFYPGYKELINEDMEYAREKFLQEISPLFDSAKHSIVVVFDGRRDFDINAHSLPKIKVIFSAFPEKADARIKDLIDHSRNKALTTVVSSDREVYQYAKVSRCNALTSDDFFRRFRKKRTNYENKIKSSTLSANEIEMWKKIFKI